MPEKSPKHLPEAKNILSRRTLLKAMGYAGLAGTTLTAVDYISPEFMYGGKEGRVGVIEDSFKSTNRTNALVLGGFGVRDAGPTAAVLAPVLSNGTNVMFAEYPRDSLDIPGTMDKFIKTTDEMGVNEISLILHSMGGTVGFHCLPYLQKYTIKDVFFLCSPSSMDDVKDRQFWANAWAKTGYPGGPISQMPPETVNNVWEHRIDELSVVGQFKESWRRASTGVSPRLKSDQVQLLHNTDIYSYIPFLQPGTNYYFLGPANTADDETIDNDSAFNGLNSVLGGTLNRLYLPGTGHADPIQHPAEYLAAFGKVLRTPEQNQALRRKP